MINHHIEQPNNSIKSLMLSHLAQELLTPLTTVMGMTSVLNQEIYGSLTSKQKEYLEVIQKSSRKLRSLVEEIVGVAQLDDSPSNLKVSAVDIESLCQQVINSLSPVSVQQKQEISLSLSPGPRLWLMDKDKVQIMLHHLVFSVIHSAGSDCVIRIHLSRKGPGINIAVWVFHPWLGESLPHAKLYCDYLLRRRKAKYSEVNFGRKESQIAEQFSSLPRKEFNRFILSFCELAAMVETLEKERKIEIGDYALREHLGLLLCSQLVEMQGGQLLIQGSSDSGYRYMLALPYLKAMELWED
jgi:two-component sensor histidine kinase